MPVNQISILSTRPISPVLVEKAASENIIVECKAFITTEVISGDEIKSLINVIAKQHAVVIFTSMNAADAVVNQLDGLQPSWKIFAIGTTTKKILTEKFSASIVCGSSKNATALAEEIIADAEIKSVTFFCGEKRRDELPGKLQEKNIKVNEIVVYKTILQQHHLDKCYQGILFFSPSAVESFFAYNSTIQSTVLFAIGDTTAKTIEQYATNKVITSDYPSKEDLLNKAILYFNNITITNDRLKK